MRIDSSGNVGINNTNPDTSLHIGDISATNATGQGRIKLEDASASLANTGGLEFATSAFGSGYGWKVNSIDSSGVHLVFGTRENSTTWSERLRITNSGSVEIKGNSGSISHRFDYNENGGEIQLLDEAGAVGTLIDQASNNTRILELVNGSNMQIGLGGSNTTGEIVFMTAGNAATARFDSSANFLVGCSAAPTGSTGGSGFITESVGRKTLKIASTTTSGAGLAEFINPNGVVGTIVTNGSATAYNTSSDQRLKENIVDAPSASNDIDAIQVRSFDWKADGSHQKYGMVAQELQGVAPDAVTEGDTEADMMGVDYSKLVPMLVKEIQSLRARVAQLETN